MPPDSRKVVMKPDTMHWLEDYYKTKDGVKIHVYLLKSSTNSENAHTIIYFQGNAGNIGLRLPIAKRFTEKLHCNVLLVSYRGYGLSEGEPSEKGIQKDAEGCLHYLLNRNDINHDKIVVYGESIGGAVAVYLTRRFPDKIKALFLENTFTSLPDLLPFVMPKLSALKFFCREKWNSLGAISDPLFPKIPILFLSSGRDTIVPPFMIEMLYKSSNGEKVEKIKSRTEAKKYTSIFIKEKDSMPQVMSQKNENEKGPLIEQGELDYSNRVQIKKAQDHHIARFPSSDHNNISLDENYLNTVKGFWNEMVLEKRKT